MPEKCDECAVRLDDTRQCLDCLFYWCDSCAAVLFTDGFCPTCTPVCAGCDAETTDGVMCLYCLKHHCYCCARGDNQGLITNEFTNVTLVFADDVAMYEQCSRCLQCQPTVVEDAEGADNEGGFA